MYFLMLLLGILMLKFGMFCWKMNSYTARQYLVFIPDNFLSSELHFFSEINIVILALFLL